MHHFQGTKINRHSNLRKIVYDKDRIKQNIWRKTEEEYKKDIWKDIKEINKDLVSYNI